MDANQATATAKRFARDLQRQLNSLSVKGTVDLRGWRSQFKVVEKAAKESGERAGNEYAKAMEKASKRIMSFSAQIGLPNAGKMESALNRAMANPTKEAAANIALVESKFAKFQSQVSKMGVAPEDWMGAGNWERQMMALQAAQRRVWGIRGMGAQAQMYGREMMGAGMAGLGGAAMAGKQYAEFAEPLGRAARNLELNAQLTAELDAKLRDLAGTASMFKPEEQASGLYQWAAATGEVVNSSGDLDALLGKVGDVQKLAHLGMVDYGTAVEAVTDIMSQFQLHTSETSMVTATLVKVAAVSKAEISDLAEAFKYVGTYAAQTNTSFNDTAAILQLLSQYGMRGSMAGRGMARLMENLIAPSKEAKAALDALFKAEFGRSNVLVDQKGQFVGMAEAIRLMAAATEDLTEAERAEFVARITTQNAARVLLPLLGAEIEARKLNISAISETGKILNDTADESTQAFVKMSRDVLGIEVSTKSAAETFQDQWTQMLESVDGRLKMLEASFNSTMVSIGRVVVNEALVPMEELAEVLRTVGDWASRNPSQIGAILKGMAWTVAIGALIAALGKGLTIYADYKAIAMAAMMKSSVDEFGIWVAAFTAAVETMPVADAIGAANRAVASAGGTFGAGAGGAAAAGAGVNALLKKFGPLLVMWIMNALSNATVEAAQTREKQYRSLEELTGGPLTAAQQEALFGAMTPGRTGGIAGAGETTGYRSGGPFSQDIQVSGRYYRVERRSGGETVLAEASPDELYQYLASQGLAETETERVVKANDAMAERWAALGRSYQTLLFAERGAISDSEAYGESLKEGSQRAGIPSTRAPTPGAIVQRRGGPMPKPWMPEGMEWITGMEAERLLELANALGLNIEKLGLFGESVRDAKYALEAFTGDAVIDSIMMLREAGNAIPTGLDLAQWAGAGASTAWGSAKNLLGIGYDPKQIAAMQDDYLTGLQQALTTASTMSSWEAELYLQAYTDAFTGMVQENLDAHKQMTKNAEQAAKDQQKLYEQAQQGLRGFAERALTPTQVTGEDVDATRAGAYKDKWDEEVRRMRAAMKGSSKWKDMIPGDIWSQGADAAYAWGENWINQFYAGMKPEAINWKALLDSIEQALAMEAGKKNLVETVLQKLAEERGITATSEQVLQALGLTGVLPMGPGMAAGMASTPEAYAEQALAMAENIIGPLGTQLGQVDMTSASSAMVQNLTKGIGTEADKYPWVDTLKNSLDTQLGKGENKTELINAGKKIGGLLWTGVYEAFEEANIVWVIAHKVVELINASREEGGV